MSSQTQKDIQKDAQQAKNEAHSGFQDAYNKTSKEARELEGRAVDAAKRGEKRAEGAFNDASKQVSKFWQTFSSDPKYWATTLGAVNAALLTGVGIYAYTNQNEVKSWDRRFVSAISVGVLTLLGGQGYLASQKAREQTGRK